MSINGNLCKCSQLIEQLHQHPLNRCTCYSVRVHCERAQHCLNPLKMHCDEHDRPFLTGVAFRALHSIPHTHTHKMVIAAEHIYIAVILLLFCCQSHIWNLAKACAFIFGLRCLLIVLRRTRNKTLST